MIVAPVKPLINFGDFEKLDIRVGTIEEVQDIEKSDKLVKLIVNFGSFKRQIVVGLRKEREDPKEIEGKQALFVINLEGFSSHSVSDIGTPFVLLSLEIQFQSRGCSL